MPAIGIGELRDLVALPDDRIAEPLLVAVPIDEVGTARERLATVLSTIRHRTAGHLIIHELPHWYSCTDSVPVDLDEPLSPLRTHARLGDAAEPLLACFAKRLLLGAGLPEGRVGPLDWLGDDLTGRNPEIAALVRDGVLGPGAGDDL